MIQLVTSAIQTGIGLFQHAAGKSEQKRAERAREVAIGELENTRYADYNQAYYEELQRRAQVGLPEEQRQYMEQQAERAAGVGLAATEDRRAGLMGIGRAQAGLAQSYTNIGLADVAARERAAQAVLGEMGQRGAQTYQEQMQLAQLDLAIAEQARQEALSKQQAGLKSTMTGLGSMIGLPKRKQTEDLYGEAPVNQGTPQAPKMESYTIDPFQAEQSIDLGSVYEGQGTEATGLNFTQGQYGLY